MHAEVFSLESLGDLDRALSTFSSKAVDAVATVRAEYLRGRADLNGREDNATVEVSHRVEALQVASEDDSDCCAYSLAEAQERLDKIRAWQEKVREEHSLFLTHATRFERLLCRTLPRCRQFLRARAAELRAYAAVQPELIEKNTATSSDAAPVSLPAGGSFPGSFMNLTEHRLPDGFVWVPLADISDAELASVASKDDFKKVPYATVTHGLWRLAEEILPRISTNPDGLDSGTFLSLDKAAGESYEDGLQRIYEAFFCRDFIYLERRRGQEKFEIINGRHRIRVALDLGWDAIPARAKDLRS